MNRKQGQRYVISALGLAALAVLWLPVVSGDGSGRTMAALLRTSRTANILCTGVLLLIIILALVQVLVQALMEARKGRLVGAVAGVISAALMVFSRFFIAGAMLSGGTDVQSGIGFYAFLVLELVCVVLSILALARTKEVSYDDGDEEEDTGQEEEDEPAPEVRTGSLHILKGIYQGETIPLEDMQPVIIGRDAAQCNLVVEGERVSRKHCSVIYVARTNSYLVCDYSHNGTCRVETDERLTKYMNVELTPGVVLYLGDKQNVIQLG